MSEKYLSVKEWKTASKDRPVKGDALLKALTAWEAGERAAPGERLVLLDELQKQAKALLKLHAGDAALAKHLAELDKAAVLRRRELDKAVEKQAEDDAKAARDAKGAKEDKDPKDGKEPKEEAVPAAMLLDPKKLLDQLNQCKRDPERRAQFAFTDASEKDKQPAVLALSPRVAGRSMFAQLQEATGVKAGAFGTAWIAGTELMLRLEKNFTGLAKKVRKPVKDCGYRITRAVVWDEKGQLLEADTEDADPAVAPGGEPRAAAERPGGEPDAPKAMVKAYLETLPGDIRALARLDPEAAAALGAQLKQAVALAQGGPLADALAALDALSSALAVAQARQRSGEASRQVPTGIVAERVRALEIAATGWQIERMRAVEGLGELVATLMTEDDPDLLEIASRVADIAVRIPEALQERLDALRTAVAAGDAAAVQTAKAAMAAQLREAAGVLKDEASALRNCEDNPFGIRVRVVAPLADALKAIQGAMAQV